MAMTTSNSTNVKAANAPGIETGRAAISNFGLKIIYADSLHPLEPEKFLCRRRLQNHCILPVHEPGELVTAVQLGVDQRISCFAADNSPANQARKLSPAGLAMLNNGIGDGAIS